MATETEMKFSLMDDHVPSAAELAQPLAAEGFSVGPARHTVHKDRYYDDPRLSLSRAGFALRRRMVDGELLATLKTLGSIDGALHRREELELPMGDTGDPGNPWPEPIAEQLRTVTDVRSLRATFEITAERVKFPLLEDDRTVAVASFDDVAARRPNGERSVHWNELEIESAAELEPEAAAAVLARAADAFGAVAALVPTSQTKLERARALLMLGASLDE